MRVLLLCLSCLLTSVHGLYEQLFQIDLEGLMKDETRMKAIFNCFIGRGSCENFQIIKETAPKLFFNNCEGCTAEQKKIFDKTVHYLAQKYPKEYAILTQSRPLPNMRSSDFEKLGDVDFTILLKDKKYKMALLACVTGFGTCDHKQYIKETIPKILQYKCQECTSEQKELLDWTVKFVAKLYPKEYKEALEKLPSELTEGEEELLKMDFTSLLQDKKELVALVDCLMDRGPCEKFQAFKNFGPKLLQDSCKNCNLKEKEKLKNVITQFAKKYPKGYAELVYKINNPLAGGEYEKLFEINFQSILKDENQVNAVLNCLMDRGSCENYQTIKDLLPKVIVTKCEDCTPEQKKVFHRIIREFAVQYPNQHNELSEKFS